MWFGGWYSHLCVFTNSYSLPTHTCMYRHTLRILYSYKLLYFADNPRDTNRCATWDRKYSISLIFAQVPPETLWHPSRLKNSVSYSSQASLLLTTSSSGPSPASSRSYAATAQQVHYCDCNQASPDNYHKPLITGLGDQTRLLQHQCQPRCVFWHVSLKTSVSQSEADSGEQKHERIII